MPKTVELHVSQYIPLINELGRVMRSGGDLAKPAQLAARQVRNGYGKRKSTSEQHFKCRTSEQSEWVLEKALNAIG